MSEPGEEHVREASELLYDEDSLQWPTMVNLVSSLLADNAAKETEIERLWALPGRVIRAYADHHGPSGGHWNISCLLAAFAIALAKGEANTE